MPVPQQVVDSFKGDKDMDRELDDKEAEAFQRELMTNYARNAKNIEVNGTIAYTAQSPWIRNKVIRENIIYDQEFNVEKYVDTIQYCEFERDIQMQAQGDQTLIGDRGVTLSGG